MRRWTYLPQFDGLRSVAVYLVLLFHCQVSMFDGGFVGVDLFFVLSGFLVSHVIWAEIDKRGTFRLDWFYSRRVRRLLPAAVVVGVLIAVLQLLVASEPQRAGMVRDGQTALIYISNWQFIADSRDYFSAASGDGSPFLHFWSLSVEEQFYLVLPLLLLGLHRLRNRPRAIPAVLVAIFVVSVALQLWWAHRDPTYAYYATETRAYQLAAGIWLAWATRQGRLRARVAEGFSLAGVVGIVVVGSSLTDLSASNRGLLATLVSVIAIAGLYDGGRGLVARLLSTSVPRYLGQISYGTYLWHWPVVLVIRQIFTLGPWTVVALAGLISTGLAALSYELMERPIRRRRVLDDWRWPVVLTGVTVSGVAAAVIIPPLLGLSVKPSIGTPTTSGSELTNQVSWADDPIPEGLDLTAALADVPDAGPLCTPDDLDSCVRVAGSGPRVMLVGDSQAAMFVDAFSQLARDHDFTLLTDIVRGCGWQAGLETSESCAQERRTFYADVLPALDVDVVVAISLSRAEAAWADRLDLRAGESLADAHRRTSIATADLIAHTGAELLTVKALVGTNGYERLGPDPLDCLSRADTLGQCAIVTPVEKPFTDGILDAIATTIDLNPVLCPDGPICRPVLGRRVIWKDPDHVTGSYLTEQRDLIWSRLEATGLWR